MPVINTKVNKCKVPMVQLSNGSEMPAIGLGSWQSSHGELYQAITDAIHAGYRHFDCAMIYGNEAAVGEAINDAIIDGIVKREDLFITGKLWPTFFRTERVKLGLKKTLSDLGIDYLDMYLIHWPMAFLQGDNLYPKDADGNMIFDDVDYLDAWKGMEKCHRDGLCKNIGVSNFNVQQLERLYSYATIKPVINQVECHPYLAQKKLLHFCTKRGITLTAYSPLGNPGSTRPPGPGEARRNLFEDPLIKQLAVKYNKHAAQILIRWQTQRGVIVIPKSVTKSRIASNIDVFDFTMTENEIHDIENLDCGYRSVKLLYGKGHKYYPFTELLQTQPQLNTAQQ